jgi:hypothetical protein
MHMIPRIPSSTRRTATRAHSIRSASMFVVMLMPIVNCDGCDPVLDAVPEPDIEVLDDEANSHLSADPWLTVAFGDVDTGQTNVRQLRFKNIKTGTLELGRVCLVAAATAEAAIAPSTTCLSTTATPFSFGPMPTIELGADEDTTLDISFTPREGGPISVFVRIESNATLEPVVAVQLTGRGTAGRLCSDDTVLDFGDVYVLESKTLTATVRNCGVRPVTIDSFLMLQNPDDAFVVKVAGSPIAAPIGPIVEGQEVVLEVTFTPTQVRLYRDNLAGIAQMTTAAPYLGEYQFLFLGNGVSPPVCRIVVIPATQNLGAVASGNFVESNVIVQSMGQCACEVTSIEGPVPDDAGFTLTSTIDLPFLLKGGAAGCPSDPPGAANAPSNLQIPVRYTAPDRPAPQIDTATLTLTTTDLVEPVRVVNLSANGGGVPFCQLDVTPVGASGLDVIQAQNRHGLISFGRVTVHGKKRAPITITNVGNTNCTINSVQWDYAPNTPNNEFLLEYADGTPANVGNIAPIVVAPNTTTTFFAVFAPTHVIESSGSFFPSFNFGSYSGQIMEGAFSGTIAGYCNLNGDSCNGVKFTTTDTLTPITGSLHNPGEFSIGFSATPVEPAIDIIPGQVDFGLVTVGCGSQERCLTVYNTGSGELVIGQPTISPVENPANFVVTAVQNPSGQWPYAIAPGSSMGVCVRYYANALGAVTADLVIPTLEGGQEAPPVTVPLSGEGTYETETTDIFDQFDDPKVDVLWVIDDSGSMGPFQTQLANNFGSFFTASNVSDADYHIAVTTTLTTDGNCIDPFGVQNCPLHEKCGLYTSCAGNDRFLTPASSNPQGQFTCNAKVSTSGNVNPSRPASDSAEAGLQAAREFLSAPKIDDPTQNGGFLRDDAKLHVIIVSDEPDQSEGPVNLYIDFFRNLKGFHNNGLVAVSAIAAGENGCTLPNGGGNLPGDTRYPTVVDELDGRFQSICDSDWTTMMSNLGLDSLGLRIEFFLSRAADPVTLDVCVRAGGATDPVCTPQTLTSDGAATGFFYDPVSNSIVFNPGSVPPRGSRIEVHYEAYCY